MPPPFPPFHPRPAPYPTPHTLLLSCPPPPTPTHPSTLHPPLSPLPTLISPRPSLIAPRPVPHTSPTPQYLHCYLHTAIALSFLAVC